MSEECSICLGSGTNLVLLCIHKFHAACLQRAYEGKSKFPCPLCRRELSDAEHDVLFQTVLAGLVDCPKSSVEGSQSGAAGGSSAADSSFADGCAVVDLTREDSNL